MPGRFLVFMPTVDHVGVSRKIESRDERGPPAQHRPASSARSTASPAASSSAPPPRGRSEEDIVSDLSYFHQVWTEIRRKMENRRPPAVLFQEQSLVTKLLRDLLTDDYTAIRIDNELEHRRVVALVERIMPNLVPRVKLYTKDSRSSRSTASRREIDKALRSKVWLKSGGYLVINQTEALVGDRRQHRPLRRQEVSGRLEDTIVKTNLEAVKEIVRQIRLRDLGGIIVLDLIDMEEKKNRQKVFQEVEKELRKDRSPSKALQVSDFGLVIVTRKRVKQSLERQLTEPCPYCSGSGLDQVERDDLLRDPDGAAEDRRRPGRAGRDAAGQPGHRAGAEGRGERGAARAAAGARQAGHDPAGHAPASRAVRRDGDLIVDARVPEHASGTAGMPPAVICPAALVAASRPEGGSGSGCRPC